MSFETVLPFILSREGGYVDDPADRGGATNKGITQGTYDAWRTDQELEVRPVQEITDEEVAEIYRELYWFAARCDRMPGKLALVHMDAAVNHGVQRAARLLQEAARVAVDGMIGPITLAAVDRASVGDLCERYLCARVEFYAQIVANDASQQKFLRGWLVRVRHVREAVA